MRIRTVKRYYCDFCKKAGLRKSTMEKHETTCFFNPKRNCFICEKYELKSPGLDQLISKANEHLDNPVTALEKVTSCPACITSALVQSEAEFVTYEYSDEMHKLRFEDNEMRRFEDSYNLGGNS